MNRDELLLNKTKQLTYESSYTKTCGKHMRVAASLYSGNTLICKGVNQNKSHPIQEKYNQYLSFRRPSCKLHAEVAALLAADKTNCDMKRTTMYIARKLNIEGFGNSRPCPACMAMIRDAGIRKIVYTTENGYAVEHIER